MTSVRVQFVDAFTDTPGHGNRAGVVLDASQLTAEEMQLIAKEAGVSETAFGIQSANPEEYDLEVRFFSQTREVPICGHATIAFHYLRAQTLNLQSQILRIKTKAGILPVTIERTENDLRIIMTQASPQVLANPDIKVVSKVLDALGLTFDDIVPGLLIQVVTTGHSKVLIPISSYTKLNELHPNMDNLKELSPQVGTNGYFVFTLNQNNNDNVLYHGRMFAPATGVDEDPVTGNAHGPTGYYLFLHNRLAPSKCNVIRYRAAQGEAMGHPGLIDVALHVSDGKVVLVQVSGQAFIVEPT